MKFSKILTTAMMALALVASSSALATETSWWSMDFDGLAIEEGGTLTNALNAAYATTQNGWWTSEEGDLTTFESDKLKLNTQGTDLTWTPNADNDTTAITYVDADVTFVGSDTAPTISETDVHTAVYLKNIVDDTSGEVTNSVLCAYVRTGSESTGSWLELSGYDVEDNGTYNLRIMLEENNLSFYINDTLLSNGDMTRFRSAKDGYAGSVDSVSFRGTGYVDNFAASQEEKVVAGKAYVTDYAFYVDNADVTSEWSYETFMGEEFVATDLTLNGSSSQIATVWDLAQSPDDGSVLGEIAAIKLVSDDQSFEVVYDDETGTFVGDSTFVIVSNVTEDGTQYFVSVDTDELVADAEYTVEFYYGEYTPSEPEPEPVKLATPVVSSSVTDTTVTLTWEAVANASSYDVTFNGTTTNVTDATSFTASDLTAETTYTFAVVANGDDENYVDSDAATVEVTTAAAAEPEPEIAPVAVAAIAIDGTTATLTIEGEYTEVKVLFCETLGGEWVEVEATFADGVATVPATTATGFFKVEAK